MSAVTIMKMPATIATQGMATGGKGGSRFENCPYSFPEAVMSVTPQILNQLLNFRAGLQFIPRIIETLLLCACEFPRQRRMLTHLGVHRGVFKNSRKHVNRPRLEVLPMSGETANHCIGLRELRRISSREERIQWSVGLISPALERRQLVWIGWKCHYSQNHQMIDRRFRKERGFEPDK